MRVYSYLSVDEVNRLSGQSKTSESISQKQSKLSKSKADEKKMAFSDNLDGFLGASQILASLSDGFSYGGIVCEFDIPKEMLKDSEILEIPSEDGEPQKFEVYVIDEKDVKKEWLKEWIWDRDFGLKAEKAKRTFDKKERPKKLKAISEQTGEESSFNRN